MLLIKNSEMEPGKFIQTESVINPNVEQVDTESDEDEHPGFDVERAVN
jgi:hypothetical protein